MRCSLSTVIGVRNGPDFAGWVTFELRGQPIERIYGLPAGFWIGVFGLVSAVVAVLAIRREARPLKALSASLAHFAISAEPTPVMPAGAPELRALAATVNDMQRRIAELLAGRTILLGAISHDLKTFLTRLRLRIDTIPDPGQQARATRDIEDMTDMIEQALAVARGYARLGPRQAVDIVALIEEERANRQDGSLRLVRPPGNSAAIVDGDPMALKRLIVNLTGNALQFGTYCEVSVTTRPGFISIFIDDDGPGVPDSERAKIFEPFYRGDPSRSRATGGNGLGLAIARQIVEGHGGTIAAGSSPLGGARFLIEIPARE